MQRRKTLWSYQASGFSFLLFCTLSQDAVGSWHLRISTRVVFTTRSILAPRAFETGGMKTVTSDNTSAAQLCCSRQTRELTAIAMLI